MKSVLVIGYGNTIRSDDAAGIHAVELISKRHPEFECICVHQLMPELAEAISKRDMVFFVDASAISNHVEVQEIQSSTFSNQSYTHFITPASLIALSLKVYGHKPRKAFIVGIPANRFDFGEEISEETKKEINRCVEIIEDLVNS